VRLRSCLEVVAVDCDNPAIGQVAKVALMGSAEVLVMMVNASPVCSFTCTLPKQVNIGAGVDVIRWH